MRVISGKYRGKRFNPPKKFPSRPTTDQAKEALFNIVSNQYDLEECKVLDLFAGTGSISLEFLSRGCQEVLSVDKHPVSIRFINSMQKDTQDDNWSVLRKEVFSFLENHEAKYDIIFADPPFGLKGGLSLPELVFEKQLLKEDGMLIIEHGRETDFSHITQFKDIRKYGGVNFSFFEEA